MPLRSALAGTPERINAKPRNAAFRNLLVLLPAVLFVVFSVAYVQSLKSRRVPPEAESLYSRAVVHVNQQEYDQAVECLTRAVAIQPAFALAFGKRGRLYVRLGRPDAALEDFTRAIELNPRSFLDYSCRGDLWFAQGRSDRAISDYSRALRINPGLTRTFNNRGTAYLRRGMYDLAFSDFHRAIESDPRKAHAAAYLNRGLIYAHRGEYEAALADLDEAVRKNPEDPMAWFHRGRVRWMRERPGTRRVSGPETPRPLGDAAMRAVDDLSRSIDLRPDYTPAYVERGNVYHAHAEIREACSDWKRACALGQCAEYERYCSEIEE